MEPRVICLVGLTGEGKSTTANTLCGNTSAFLTSAGLESATHRCSFADYTLEGVRYRVIDTPGMQDTHFSADEILQQFRTFADLAPNGVDVFLLVFRKGRFRAECADVVRAFQTTCENSALDHAMLLFTHLGDVSGTDFVESLVQCTAPDLVQSLEKVGGRACGMENTAGGEERRQLDRVAVHMLIDKLRSSHNGQRYSNQCLKDAQRWRLNILEKIGQLNEPSHRTLMEREVTSLLHGRQTREAVEIMLTQIEEREREACEQREEAAMARLAEELACERLQEVEQQAEEEARAWRAQQQQLEQMMKDKSRSRGRRSQDSGPMNIFCWGKPEVEPPLCLEHSMCMEHCQEDGRVASMKKSPAFASANDSTMTMRTFATKYPFCCISNVERKTGFFRMPCRMCFVQPASVVEIPCGHVSICSGCQLLDRSNSSCLRCRESIKARFDVRRSLDSSTGGPSLCHNCRVNPARMLMLPCLHLILCPQCMPDLLGSCPTCGEIVDVTVEVQWEGRILCKEPPSNRVMSLKGGVGLQKLSLTQATLDIDAEITRLEEQLWHIRRGSTSDCPSTPTTVWQEAGPTSSRPTLSRERPQTATVELERRTPGALNMVTPQIERKTSGSFTIQQDLIEASSKCTSVMLTGPTSMPQPEPTPPPSPLATPPDSPHTRIVQTS